MPGLSIRPHSRRITGYAVAGLSLVALGSFGMGLRHQMGFNGAAYFPAAQGPLARAGAIPEATPAPDMQLAVADPPPRRHPRPAAAADDSAADPAAPTADVPTPAAQAAPAGAADASTTEAEAPAAPPQPPAAPAPSDVSDAPS